LRSDITCIALQKKIPENDMVFATKLHVLTLSTACLFATGAAHSAVIDGGSSLLTPTNGYANQLESWLVGDTHTLTLTNIFTKQAGTPGEEGGRGGLFNNAMMANQGPTFVVMGGTEYFSGKYAIYGGYNPQPWNFSPGGYITTADDAHRTAFLFNLTTGALHRQLLGVEAGAIQTLNAPGSGPIFGGSDFDIFVDQSLSNGHSSLYSYANGIIGLGSNAGRSIIDGSPYSSSFGNTIAIDELEVFTISLGAAVPGPAIPALLSNPIPEPGTLALLSVALLGFAVRRRRS
jgi:TLD/PEP-CTERM motif